MLPGEKDAKLQEDHRRSCSTLSTFHTQPLNHGKLKRTFKCPSHVAPLRIIKRCENMNPGSANYCTDRLQKEVLFIHILTNFKPS